MWIRLAFFSLGLLVGHLAGFSATSVVTQLIGLFFALAGGSVIAFLRKLSAEDRKVASQALFAVTLGCLVGLYVSIVMVQWQLLSPSGGQLVGNSAPASGEATGPSAERGAPRGGRYFYLRARSSVAGIIACSNDIDEQRRSGGLTLEEAYERTCALIHGDADDDTD